MISVVFSSLCLTGPCHGSQVNLDMLPDSAGLETCNGLVSLGYDTLTYSLYLGLIAPIGATRFSCSSLNVLSLVHLHQPGSCQDKSRTNGIRICECLLWILLWIEKRASFFFLVDRCCSILRPCWCVFFAVGVIISCAHLLRSLDWKYASFYCQIRIMISFLRCIHRCGYCWELVSGFSPHREKLDEVRHGEPRFAICRVAGVVRNNYRDEHWKAKISHDT